MSCNEQFINGVNVWLSHDKKNVTLTNYQKRNKTTSVLLSTCVLDATGKAPFDSYNNVQVFADSRLVNLIFN